MPDIDLLITAFDLHPAPNSSEEEKLQLINFLIAKKVDLARDYFSKNPDSMKMGHEKRDKSALQKDCSVLIIQTADGIKTYLLAAQGQYIDEGASGRVKLAICIDPPDDEFKLYAVKREWTNTSQQQEETKHLTDTGRIVGEKMSRTSTTKKRPSTNEHEVNKYYTLMPYYGENLAKVLLSKRLDEKAKLDIAIDIALAVDELHTKYEIAHLDIKPKNIVLERSGDNFAVTLIDFGFSKKLHEDITKYFIGTVGYFPGIENGLSGPQVKPNAEETFKQLKSSVDLDTFALKRTLNNEDSNRATILRLLDIDALIVTNPILHELLSTNDEAKSIARRDTPAIIAANLILHKLKLYPICHLKDKECRELLATYKANKDNPENLASCMQSALNKVYKEHAGDEDAFKASAILNNYLNVPEYSTYLNQNTIASILELEKNKTISAVERDAKLVLLYLGIKDFDAFLKTEADYQNLVTCYTNAAPEDATNKVLEHLIRNYVVKNSDNINYTPLIECYKNYFYALKQNAANPQRIQELEQNFAQILFIQQHHLEFFNEFIDARFISQLNKPELEHARKICDAVTNEENRKTSKDQKGLTEKQSSLLNHLDNLLKASMYLGELGLAGMKPAFMDPSKGINVQLLEMAENIVEKIKNGAEADDIQKDKIKFILACCNMEDILDDEEISGMSRIFLTYFEGRENLQCSDLASLAPIVVINIIKDCLSEDYINNNAKEAYLFIFEVYQKIDDPKPSFVDIINATAYQFETNKAFDPAGENIEIKTEVLSEIINNEVTIFRQNKLKQSVEDLREEYVQIPFDDWKDRVTEMKDIWGNLNKNEPGRYTELKNKITNSALKISEYENAYISCLKKTECEEIEKIIYETLNECYAAEEDQEDTMQRKR